MIRRITFGILMGLLLLTTCATVLADNDTNDSLNTPETLEEGTYTGDVSINVLTEDDVDYYVISIPAKKDIKVTAEKTDSGEGSITIDSYDHNKESLGFLGIFILLTAPGETDTDTYYNSEDSSRNIYLEVSGDGEYELSIEFTSETEEAVKGVAAFCGASVLLMICVPLGAILAIVVIIIIIVKVSKKKK